MSGSSSPRHERLRGQHRRLGPRRGGLRGYPGLAGLILVENLFPPIPSELILPLAGFYVSTGQFAFIWAVLAATASSLVGALLIYALARRGGRPLLLPYGRLLRIREADLDRSEAWFDRFGGWLVLGGRLVPGARSLVSVPAGLTRMPLGRLPRSPRSGLRSGTPR